MSPLRRGNGITALEPRSLPAKANEPAHPRQRMPARSIVTTRIGVSRMEQSTHIFGRLGVDTLIGGVSR